MHSNQKKFPWSQEHSPTSEVNAKSGIVSHVTMPVATFVTIQDNDSSSEHEYDFCENKNSENVSCYSFFIFSRKYWIEYSFTFKILYACLTLCSKQFKKKAKCIYYESWGGAILLCNMHINSISFYAY